jgi:PPM family protein phosphatase
VVTKPQLKFDTGTCKYRFEINDRLMLCSDGLYDYLNESEIAEVLNTKSLQEAAEHMISEAKRRGGHDNITVVLSEKTEPVRESIAKETKDFDLPQTREYDLP